MENKEKYRGFCKTEEGLPIFMQDWWLDTVCGVEGWNAAVYEQNNKIVGVFPYPLKKKYFYKVILSPHLTRWLGPWVRYPNDLEDRKKPSFEHQVHEKLIDQLPKVDWIQIGCAPVTVNLKAFFWNGFVLSLRYISVVEKYCDLNNFFDGLSKETRKRIQKATELYKIVSNFDFNLSLELFKKPYERQGLKFKISDSLIKKLFEKCTEHKSVMILGAENQKTKEIDSVIFCVWDRKYFYLLMSGGNDTSRNRHAKYLLTFEAIKIAWSKNLAFSFDGSMKKSIDSFNRKFLTQELTYYTIEKINSKILKYYFALKK